VLTQALALYAGQVRDEPLNRIASEKAVAILDPDGVLLHNVAWQKRI
jgi:hypothetical protein